METFTVQPKFEGNAQDFGMVIPTPSQPKLHEMPRDFFKHLAVYSILKKREMPQSKLLHLLLPPPPVERALGGLVPASSPLSGTIAAPAPPPVRVLEAGVVGSLD